MNAKKSNMRKEIPILFSTSMVQAILDDRKSMTRRVVKPQPDENGVEFMPNAPSLDWEQVYKDIWRPWIWDTEEGESIMKDCPYGQPGDLLWVRESWCKITNASKEEDNRLHYRASTGKNNFTWKPSIHMMKSDARIWLQVTDVRVERLNDISEEDAIAEGILKINTGYYKNYLYDTGGIPPFASFRSLWQSINGPESWDANPWVWVVSYKVVSKMGI